MNQLLYVYCKGNLLISGTLFKHGQVLTDDTIKQSAASLGLEVNRFDREFDDGTYSSHVNEDIESGRSSGVKSTPTFFINGDRYDGTWDLDSLLSALDEPSVFGWRVTNSSDEYFQLQWVLESDNRTNDA